MNEEELGIPKIPHDKRIGNKAKLGILDEAESILSAYYAQSENDFMAFVRGLTIASQTGPRVFDACMAGFQRKCFEEIAPSIQALRDGEMPEHRRWWIERTKKAAKDSDLAVILLWLLAFPVRPFFAQVGAADSDQAGIVKKRMAHILHLNPWLNDRVEMVQNTVRSRVHQISGKEPMAKVEILSADVAGSHGETPDLLVINELSHITKWEFAENLMDNADGVVQGMVIIATNAGFKGTKPEVWRNNAIKNWVAHIWAKPAPWHNKATIEDAERRNPPSRYKRLWWGRWASGKGDALSEEDIDRCFRLDGPLLIPEPGWRYIGGLDLGVSHDHSGLVITGIHVEDQQVKTARWWAWEPNQKTGEVYLPDVEDMCVQASKLYRLECLYYDPSQAKLMSQQLARKGVVCREMTFVAKNTTAMATCLIQLIESGRLACYDDPDGRLRRDFGKFNLVEKSYGVKLEAVSDETGHADVGTALIITLPPALEMLNGMGGLLPTDDLVALDDSKLSDEEIEDLPDELREIYGSEQDQEIEHRLGREYDPLDNIF